MVAVLSITSALAVDYGQYNYQRAREQTIVDFAAIRGAKVIDDGLSASSLKAQEVILGSR